MVSETQLDTHLPVIDPELSSIDKEACSLKYMYYVKIVQLSWKEDSVQSVSPVSKWQSSGRCVYAVAGGGGAGTCSSNK